MTTYIKYQCSTCRRTKDIEQDNVRVLPNKCTITKGCAGFLSAIAKTSQQSQVLAVNGLQDWYPRGTAKTVATVETPAEFVNATTSLSGAFTVAVRGLADDLPDSIEVVFLQRRSVPIAFQDFVFKATELTSVFSGRDVNGKILRIDALAITENRVEVRVNGVLNEASLTTTSVIPSSPVVVGGIVSVRVRLENDTVERSVTLKKNSTLTPSSIRGSWSNISTINAYEGGVRKQYVLYSTDTFAELGVGKLKLAGVNSENPAMILLAHEPFGQRDRYLNFAVLVDDVIGEEEFTFDMSTGTSSSFCVDRRYVKDLFPPLEFNPDSFIEKDHVETEASSRIIKNELNALLKSKKILGPV